MKYILSTLAHSALALVLSAPNHILASEVPVETENLVDCTESKNEGDITKLEKMDYEEGIALRIFTTKDAIHYFEVPTDTDRVAASEKARATRVANDLKTLMEIAKTTSGISADKAAVAKGAPVKYCYKFTQGYKRSTLSIKPLNSTKPNEKYGEAQIITGPQESFWISADMGLDNIKQLTLDANSKPVEKEKPASFYVGFNYKLGDVYKNYDVIGAETYKNISVKFLALASNSPSESMGAGLGYDFPWVNVFIASVWTKDDQSVGGSIGTTRSNMVGISFDLSRGLEWLKQSK
jgi:hypothetical protein